jgi:hypothetical protein
LIGADEFLIDGGELTSASVTSDKGRELINIPRGTLIWPSPLSTDRAIPGTAPTSPRRLDISLAQSRILSSKEEVQGTMTKLHSGRCQCGTVTYEFSGDPLFTYACHCSDCQKRTGSAFSMGTVVPAHELKVQGRLTDWSRTSEAGNTNTRYSCAACGNIIYGIGSANPELAKLQSGTLDDTSTVEPELHIWTRSKQPWVELSPFAKQFRQQSDDPTEVLAAVAAFRQAKGVTV